MTPRSSDEPSSAYESSAGNADVGSGPGGYIPLTELSSPPLETTNGYRRSEAIHRNSDDAATTHIEVFAAPPGPAKRQFGYSSLVLNTRAENFPADDTYFRRYESRSYHSPRREDRRSTPYIDDVPIGPPKGVLGRSRASLNCVDHRSCSRCVAQPGCSWCDYLQECYWGARQDLCPIGPIHSLGKCFSRVNVEATPNRYVERRGAYEERFGIRTSADPYEEGYDFGPILEDVDAISEMERRRVPLSDVRDDDLIDPNLRPSPAWEADGLPSEILHYEEVPGAAERGKLIVFSGYDDGTESREALTHSSVSAEQMHEWTKTVKAAAVSTTVVASALVLALMFSFFWCFAKYRRSAKSDSSSPVVGANTSMSAKSRKNQDGTGAASLLERLFQNKSTVNAAASVAATTTTTTTTCSSEAPFNTPMSQQPFVNDQIIVKRKVADTIATLSPVEQQRARAMVGPGGAMLYMTTSLTEEGGGELFGFTTRESAETRRSPQHFTMAPETGCFPPKGVMLLSRAATTDSWPVCRAETSNRELQYNTEDHGDDQAVKGYDETENHDFEGDFDDDGVRGGRVRAGHCRLKDTRNVIEMTKEAPLSSVVTRVDSNLMRSAGADNWKVSLMDSNQLRQRFDGDGQDAEKRRKIARSVESMSQTEDLLQSKTLFGFDSLDRAKVMEVIQSRKYQFLDGKDVFDASLRSGGKVRVREGHLAPDISINEVSQEDKSCCRNTSDMPHARQQPKYEHGLPSSPTSTIRKCKGGAKKSTSARKGDLFEETGLSLRALASPLTIVPLCTPKNTQSSWHGAANLPLKREIRSRVIEWECVASPLSQGSASPQEHTYIELTASREPSESERPPARLEGAIAATSEDQGFSAVADASLRGDDSDLSPEVEGLGSQVKNLSSRVESEKANRERSVSDSGSFIEEIELQRRPPEERTNYQKNEQSSRLLPDSKSCKRSDNATRTHDAENAFHEMKHLPRLNVIRCDALLFEKGGSGAQQRRPKNDESGQLENHGADPLRGRGGSIEAAISLETTTDSNSNSPNISSSEQSERSSSNNSPDNQTREEQSRLVSPTIAAVTVPMTVAQQKLTVTIEGKEGGTSADQKKKSMLTLIKNPLCLAEEEEEEGDESNLIYDTRDLYGRRAVNDDVNLC